MKGTILNRRTFLTLGSVVPVALWMCIAVSLANAQGAGTVEINNATRPRTHIEVGQTIEIHITGANSIAEVYVTVNGTGPYFQGYTDGNGNAFFYYDMTSADVGDYNEVWYAGGFDPIYQLSPFTNYSPYLGAQPRLPMFTVYNNYAGGADSNCPGLALIRSQCNGTRVEQHRWIWQPVTFASTSAIAPQAMVNAAADLWNAIQMPSKVNLSSDTSGHWDVNVLDAPTPQFFAGITAVYSQEFCNPNCFNRILECNGTCIRSGSIYVVQEALNVNEIDNYAMAWGSDRNTITTTTVRHELGHVIGVGHAAAPSNICSEAQALLNVSTDLVLGCGITAPTACDRTGINTVYSVGPASCPTNIQSNCSGNC